MDFLPSSAPVPFGKVTQRADKVAIIAGGDSLRGVDLSPLRRPDIATIAVNDAILHTHADYWITVDPNPAANKPLVVHQRPNTTYFAAVPEGYGWENNPDSNFRFPARADVTYLHRIVPFNGFSYNYALAEDPSQIRTGDSSYGALGLAYHLRPSRIVIFGWDGGGRRHWFDTKPTDVPFDTGTPACATYLSYLPVIARAALPQLKARNIQIRTGSLVSRIDAFDKLSPEAAIAWLLS